MKISIIIPVHNEEENIGYLINSIIKNKTQNKEIIVVDDGSTDNTRNIIKKYGKLIKYFYIKKSGVSKARNVGIKNSTGSLIFFFDGDVILKRNTLKKFISFFNKNKNLNILQGIWEKKYIKKTNYITKHLLLKLNFNFETKSKKEKKYFTFKGTKVTELLTGCLAVRKKVLKRIRFNENYKYSGGEEFELGSRLSDKYEIFYTSKIKIYHEFENIFTTLKRIFYRTINYSFLLFNSKNNKAKVLNKSNETSIPSRDKVNVFVMLFLLLNLPLSFISLNFLFLSILIFLFFCFNNLKLLLYVKKHLNFTSMIKSCFVEFLIIFCKTFAIMISILLFYIFNFKTLKI